jgi:hypothetical protein
MTLDELVTQLRAVYGTGLRSVVLYGSAAAGQHIPKRSDYNVLVIVDSLAPELLRAAAATAQAWTEAKNPPPLTLTDREWRTSADIFPMEYSDIIERHRVLFGEAPFTGITVERRDLRLQLERESMGSLLRFRQGVLAAGGDKGNLLQLLEASISTVMVLFRAVVRLDGGTPAAENTALAQQTAELVHLDATPFVRVLRHVRGDEKLSSADAESLLGGYAAGLEELVHHLDQYSSL